jgi:hypothetical protein
MSVRGTLRAFLVAPLAAPAIYWAIGLARAVADPSRRATLHPLNGLFVIMTFGAPVAYPSALAAGILLLLAARGRRPRFIVALAAGVAAGAAVAHAIAPQLRGELISVPMDAWRGAIMGAGSAAVWWALLVPAEHRAVQPHIIER